MCIDGWRYYNRAFVPTVAPHESPNLEPILDGTVWKDKNKPLLVRWTENFDCEAPTNFWWCILDKPFDISKIKAKRRYDINRGNRFFEVREIDPLLYVDELSNVQTAAFSAYPKKYRPAVDFLEFSNEMKIYSERISRGSMVIYGAFLRETSELCGFLIVTVENGCMCSIVLKVNPEYEKFQINAALIYKWVVDSDGFLSQGGYLHDGTRTINHESAFQDYLERQFGFRKAYCSLKIKYRPIVRPVVSFLYFFRKVLRCFDNIGIIHSINAVIKMEEIAREDMVNLV